MKIILFILGVLLTTLAFAQADIKCISLTDPDLRIFYSEIENEVKIIGVKMDTTVKLTSGIGTVHHYSSKDESEYVVKYKRENIDTLRIFKNGELIFEDKFEIYTLPIPKAKLGGIESNSASVEEILNDPEIKVVLEDCHLIQKCTFKTFDLIIIDESGNIVVRYDRVHGNKLQKEHQEKIKELKPGHSLIIKNMIASVPGTEGRPIRPLSITIK